MSLQRFLVSLCTIPLLSFHYGVATISRLLKIIGLFGKRALQNRRYSVVETYNFKKPTNRSHPISCIYLVCLSAIAPCVSAQSASLPPVTTSDSSSIVYVCTMQGVQGSLPKLQGQQSGLAAAAAQGSTRKEQSKLDGGWSGGTSGASAAPLGTVPAASRLLEPRIATSRNSLAYATRSKVDSRGREEGGETAGTEFDAPVQEGGSSLLPKPSRVGSE